ncbi:peptidyl-prolyl cis-trans isomerase FKBP4 isoform X2 [Amia ocellicauda]
MKTMHQWKMQGGCGVTSWVSLCPGGYRGVRRRTLEKGTGEQTPKLGSVCSVMIQTDPQADAPTSLPALALAPAYLETDVPSQEGALLGRQTRSRSSVLQVPINQWVQVCLGEGHCDIIEGCLEGMKAGETCELQVTALEEGKTAHQESRDCEQRTWKSGAEMAEKQETLEAIRGAEEPSSSSSSSSSPSPSRCCHFIVQLHSFTPGKASWEMAPDEKWVWVRSHKERGSERFRAGDVWGAADCYSRALRMLITLGGPGENWDNGQGREGRGEGEEVAQSKEDSIEGEGKERVREGEYQRVRSELHCNLSLCQLKLGQPSKARENASRATGLDPASAKAWYRLGLAYSELGEMGSARAGLRRVLELQPGSPSALRALREIEAREKEINSQLGQALSKMFT